MKKTCPFVGGRCIGDGYYDRTKRSLMRPCMYFDGAKPDDCMIMRAVKAIIGDNDETVELVDDEKLMEWQAPELD